MGARGGASGDFINAASDPRGFVKAELSRPNGALLELPGLASTPALAKAVFDYQFEIQQARDAAARSASTESPPPPADARPQQRRGLSLNNIAMEMAPKEPAMQPAEAGKPVVVAPPAETMQPNAKQEAKPAPQPPNVIQKTFRTEALARIQRAVIADCGFVERLVAFWSNHFCISASKGGLARMWAGSFEREAIRPFVFGRFADMLKAVEQHPAMLFFLDNQQSLGPDSRAGINRNRGLNENLAREIMELHTLGVDGGYTQDDVTSLARVITGWTYAGRQGALGTPGTFVFNANAHQPGRAARARQDLRAERRGRRARRCSPISRAIPRPRNSSPPNSSGISSPTIRRRRWSRSCRHVFAKTDGDLKAMTLALVDSDEAWKAPLTKVRCAVRIPDRDRPRCWRASPRIPAAISAASQHARPAAVVAGRPRTVSPTRNAAWAAPEGHEAAARHLRADRLAPRRQRRSARPARRRRRPMPPRPRRAAPSSAPESRQQALALLLMSPEFQRR